jgi:NAD(P)-dependent dehydrogenase (short-subunit alcohol dehydrogenase family)
MLAGIKLFDLTGKTALVTGGSKGLGYAIAEGFASAGASVALLARNEAEVSAASDRLAIDSAQKTLAIRGDVTNEADVRAAVDATLGAFGALDILVNSAGINIRGPIDELTLEQFREVNRINVEGTWLMSRAVVAHMKDHRGGRTINLASALGLVGLGDRTPYCASKGAIVQMTRALAIEVAPFNITVNAICPGPFLTEMNLAVKDDPKFVQFILGATALGRWGELEEIQGSAIYLASAAGGYTTGATLVVDGGWTAR